jgi:hypothetical protein
MATNFRNKVGANIGTTPVTLVTAGASSKITIIGFSLTNLTEGVVVASVSVTDDTATTGHYIKNVPIPPNQSLRIVNGGEKLILAPTNSIAVVANQSSALDVIISYVEIT